ncbi:MAG TPA: DUF4118 domain-containing protein, partial [Gemmatimonadales bacterium]|nr:DUF4118 domain-containing protein [Gemmatimonadales bacterium]
MRERVLRYLLAVIAPAAAAIVLGAVRPLVSPSVTPPFLLAVAITALYGGKGPGALASLLSVAALNYWFFPPLGGVAVLGMFLTVAAGIAWIAGSSHDQRRRSVEQAGEYARLREVAEKTAARAEVAAAELADFFDTASMAMHWVGPDGTILRANQAELDLLGYTADEYVGHPISEFHVDQPGID